MSVLFSTNTVLGQVTINGGSHINATVTPGITELWRNGRSQTSSCSVLNSQLNDAEERIQ